SACSRTLHVLISTRSASAASSVASNPACSRSPAIRSESWTFIWQPKVSIRYLRTTPTSQGFRFRPFAFAPPLPRRTGSGRSGAPVRRRPLLQHLTSGCPQPTGDRVAAEHAGDLVDPAGLIEPRDQRARAPAFHTLLDAEVRIGVGRNLREMRDAEDLEGRA